MENMKSSKESKNNNNGHLNSVVLMGESRTMRVKQTTPFQDSKGKRNFSIGGWTRQLHRFNPEYMTQISYPILDVFIPTLFERVLKQNRNHCKQHRITMNKHRFNITECTAEQNRTDLGVGEWIGFG